MTVEGRDFDSDHTVGETKALLAPLFNTDAEHIHGYLVLYIGEVDGQTTLGIVSNDQHATCRIGLLAQAISFIAADAGDSDA